MFKTLITDGIETDYIINEDCEVINLRTNRKISVYPIDDNHRYARVRLFVNGKWYQKGIHRVLMETFRPIENSVELEVNHIDGNRANNSLSNLEWVTPSENVKHAFKLGLRGSLKGENNPRSIWTQEQVIQICELLCAGKSEHNISELFNISPTLIHNIRSHTAWTEISSKYVFPEKKGNTRITEEDAINICEMIKNGESNETIAFLFGLKPSYIKDFRNKRTWKQVTGRYDF